MVLEPGSFFVGNRNTDWRQTDTLWVDSHAGRPFSLPRSFASRGFCVNHRVDGSFMKNRFTTVLLALGCTIATTAAVRAEDAKSTIPLTINLPSHTLKG